MRLLSGLTCALALLSTGCPEPNTQPVRDVTPIVAREPAPPLWKTPGHLPERYTPRPLPTPRVAPRERTATSRTLAGLRVLIDPGHGGKDPGALGDPLNEKAVNLLVARRLKRELQARGARVSMTRQDDRFIELDARARMAERMRVDYFVSIHADAAPNNSQARGPTIFIARGASRTSRNVATAIDRELRSAGFPSRGVRERGFRVLVGHSRPAALVECGFLTNRAEAKLLSTPRYQAEISVAIARGIEAHFSRTLASRTN